MIVILLVFIIPEDIKREATVFIYDETKVVENFVAQAVGLEDAEHRMGEYYVDSREAIIEGMTEKKAAIGLIVSDSSDGKYDVELLTQPYTTDAIVRYIEIDLEDLLALISPPYDFYPAEVRESVLAAGLVCHPKLEVKWNVAVLLRYRRQSVNSTPQQRLPLSRGAVYFL